MKKKEATALWTEMKLMFGFTDLTEYSILEVDKDGKNYELVITWIPKRREELLLIKFAARHNLDIEVSRDKTTFRKKSV